MTFLRESAKTLKVLYKRKKIIEEKLKIAEKLYLNSVENFEIKKKLFEEKQVDNINYLNAIIDKEYYRTLKDMLFVELEILKIKINRTISRR